MYQDGNHDWIGHVNGRRFRVPQALWNKCRQDEYNGQYRKSVAEATYLSTQMVLNPAFWYTENIYAPDGYRFFADSITWIDPA